MEPFLQSEILDLLHQNSIIPFVGKITFEYIKNGGDSNSVEGSSANESYKVTSTNGDIQQSVFIKVK